MDDAPHFVDGISFLLLRRPSRRGGLVHPVDDLWRHAAEKLPDGVLRIGAIAVALKSETERLERELAGFREKV